MSARTAARRRLGSIRLSLILLALVPSVTLAAIWGVTTTQMFAEGLRLRHQTELSRSTGAMGTDATLALQRERGLSAAWLASPHGSRAALDAQRRTTDTALAKLQGRSAAVRSAPTRISERMYSVIASTKSLEYYRGQVDRLTDITADQVLDQYTSIIDDQIQAFQELSQVDDGDLTSQAACCWRWSTPRNWSRRRTRSSPSPGPRAGWTTRRGRISRNWSARSGGWCATRSCPRCAGTPRPAPNRSCRARTGRPCGTSRTRCSRRGSPAVRRTARSCCRTPTSGGTRRWTGCPPSTPT